MAKVTGLTAERMISIEQASVVNGSVDVEGHLKLETRGGNEIDAGNVRGPQGLGPTGTISMFAGMEAPAFHLICDGSAVSRSSYADLFSIIGTTYGAGDGFTTFNIPNLKGKVVVGVDPAQSEFDTLGEMGGEKSHTLSADEMPAHTHTQDAHNHTQDAHTHVQDSHDHTQYMHTHSQNSHDHSQVSHDHNQDAHNHTMQTPRWLSADDLSSGTMFGGTEAFDRVRGRETDHATANNHSTTANNYGSTASNNDTRATNYGTTATNNGTTAANNATTATNQPTGGGAAHNNLQPYVSLNYIIRT